MQPTQLPGVFALIKESWSVYKAQVRSILLIMLIEVFAVFALIAAIMVGVVLTSWSMTFIYLDIPVGLILLVLLVWFETWMNVSLLHVIKSRTSYLPFKEATKRARHQAWPYIWLNILVGAVFLGILWIGLLIGGVIVWPLSFASAHVSVAVGVLIGALVLAALVVAAIWFAFTRWVFIDEDTKGIQAIARSKEIVSRALGGIFLRFLGLTVSYLLASFIISLIVRLLLIPLDTATAAAVERFISNLISGIVFAPMFLAAAFLLYRAAKELPPAGEKADADRKVLRILAWIGLLGIVGVAIAVTVIGIAR